MAYKFTKTEIDHVTWSEHRTVPCPYCHAPRGNSCNRLNKDGTPRPDWDGYMYDHHRTRAVAYLLTQLFIIKEELEYADLVA